MSEKIPSIEQLAEIANIARGNLRNNIRILLRMVLKQGYVMNEKIAKKMDSEYIKGKSRGSYP